MLQLKYFRLQERQDKLFFILFYPVILSKILKEEAIRRNNLFQVFVNYIQPYTLFKPQIL